MNYRIILALDPSGNYTEGKGTTGWCVFDSINNKILVGGSISASNYKSQEEYWDAHLKLIDAYNKQYKKQFIVVIEDYILYANRATSQINSKLETPKVIGVIQHHLYKRHIPYHMQLASLVKNRWNNNILQHKKFLAKQGKVYVLPGTTEVIDRHCIDSIRHAVHYATFVNRR